MTRFGERAPLVKIRADFDLEIRKSPSMSNPEIDRPAGRSSCSAAGRRRLRGANGGERSGWTLRRAGSSVPALSVRQPRVRTSLRNTRGEYLPRRVDGDIYRRNPHCSACLHLERKLHPPPPGLSCQAGDLSGSLWGGGGRFPG